MKKFLIVLYLLLFANFLSATNTDENEIQAAPPGVNTNWNGQIGGYVLPAEGTIRVFFVFAQFPDDNYDVNNATWIKGQAPSDMNSWVDQTWSSSPTQGSMTHYFNEMSFNKLKFIGRTASVVTPHSRQWYIDNSKQRGFIHKEIIEQLDQTWDFAQFDNWDYNNLYSHTNQADGVVEMVIIVWRNIAHEYTKPQSDDIYDELHMGRYGDLGYGADIQVDGGQRVVKMGYWPSGTTPGGSGVTLTDWFSENMFRFSIHEFAHYLEGGNEQHVGYGFWGLLSGWGIKSFVPNAFERYRLGWINLNTIQSTPAQTIQSATLPDFITTGVAYRLVINESTKEYFYIENHQKISFWENNSMFLRSPYGNVENGIYVLRQDGANGENIQLVAADGRFNWAVNQVTPNPWGSGDLPVFKQLNADRVNGFHDLQLIPWTWNGVTKKDAIHFTENANGQPVLDVRYSGDGKDAFRIGYNEVFTPWSNPNSQRKAISPSAPTPTPFGMKLNSLTNGVYSLDIFVDQALNTNPSKPINFAANFSGSHPVLNWSANIEPDLYGYRVYKKLTTVESGTMTSYTFTTETSYADNWFNVGSGRFNRDNAEYWVVAVDNTNKLSVETDHYNTNGTSLQQWKIAQDGERDKTVIEKFNLSQNYPNPFNPSTEISYQIPSKGFVTLKIYDVLGNEVATLVNEWKETGSYTAQFNTSGKQLASGMYFYTLSAGKFSDTKKFILLK